MKKKIKRYYLTIFDLAAINLSVFLALLFKYGIDIPNDKIEFFLNTFILVSIVKVLIFNFYSLYNSLWEFASIEELIQVVTSVVISNLVVVLYYSFKHSMIPFTIYVNIVLLEIVMIGGIRFSYRVLRRIKNRNPILRQDVRLNVLIVGAGATAGMIAKEIRNHPKVYGELKGFIDDDPTKIGKTINGIKVVGNRYDIRSICKKYNIDQIIIAIPTADKISKLDIIEECSKTNCLVKTVPGISELIDGNVSMTQIRDVNIEDLLGRDSVNLELDKISNYIENKTVLVTGGGGSIGSEICRQIAKFKPKGLIILDNYENNAYEIQNELKRIYGNSLNLHTLIASVRDADNIDKIFSDLSPDVVFHAAAHKHVPLMETAPREAILNNCFGTLNVVSAADKYKVDKFVMISTDKAVNPTNVMGASKRICEMIVQSYAKRSDTKFSAVRFGNVLGSNGSVIPLFKKQIETGGPVTVTHREIIRYFMTIPEASQLVIQSGAYAKGGEIFILDMGEPISIYRLAEDLIRLSGFEPGRDIKIELTGLRPGEKLFEELLMDEEEMRETPHSKIFISRQGFIEFKVLIKMLDNLKLILLENDNDNLREQIKLMVSSYRPNHELNETFVKNGCKINSVNSYRAVKNM